VIPCDFIGFCQALNPLGNHHDLLMSSELESEADPPLEHDSSTNALIRRYRRLQAASS